MNFVSVLEKIGKVLATGVGIATGMEPLLQTVLPAKVDTEAGTVVSDLQQVGNLVTTVEGVGQALEAPGLTDSQKVAAISPQVGVLIQQTLWFKALGKPIKDQTLFATGCSDLTKGVQEILQSIGD
jgi:hypothetical protein